VKSLEVCLSLRNAPFGVDIKEVTGGLVSLFVRYIRHGKNRAVRLAATMTFQRCGGVM
jgi:hypothetical protein